MQLFGSTSAALQGAEGLTDVEEICEEYVM